MKQLLLASQCYTHLVLSQGEASWLWLPLFTGGGGCGSDWCLPHAELGPPYCEQEREVLEVCGNVGSIQGLYISFTTLLTLAFFPIPSMCLTILTSSHMNLMALISLVWDTGCSMAGASSTGRHSSLAASPQQKSTPFSTSIATVSKPHSWEEKMFL